MVLSLDYCCTETYCTENNCDSPKSVNLLSEDSAENRVVKGQFQLNHLHEGTEYKVGLAARTSAGSILQPETIITDEDSKFRLHVT